MMNKTNFRLFFLLCASIAFLFLWNINNTQEELWENEIQTYIEPFIFIDFSDDVFDIFQFLTEDMDGLPVKFAFADGLDLSKAGLQRGDKVYVEYEIISDTNGIPCDPYFVALKITPDK